MFKFNVKKVTASVKSRLSNAVVFETRVVTKPSTKPAAAPAARRRGIVLEINCHDVKPVTEPVVDAPVVVEPQPKVSKKQMFNALVNAIASLLNAAKLSALSFFNVVRKAFSVVLSAVSRFARKHVNLFKLTKLVQFVRKASFQVGRLSSMAIVYAMAALFVLVAIFMLFPCAITFYPAVAALYLVDFLSKLIAYGFITHIVSAIVETIIAQFRKLTAKQVLVRGYAYAV